MSTKPAKSSSFRTAIANPAHSQQASVKPISSQHPHSHQSEPAFVCTICWQPQPEKSKPKVLGSSARIVCKSCWRAVLDLSICWVCGECIVRGDDVVSLGWCFWHKGCFGCLVCGEKLEIPRVQYVSEEEAGELGKWGKLKGQQKGIGVELTDIPLCGACTAETAGASGEKVLEKGLETVTKMDGGLSRDRLLMMSGQRDEEMRLLAGGSSRKARGETSIEHDLKNFMKRSSRRTLASEFQLEEYSSLLGNAAGMAICEDGTMDVSHEHSDTERAQFGQESPDQSDPDTCVPGCKSTLGSISKPGKPKAVPKWMDLLPNNVSKAREGVGRTTIVEGNHFRDRKGKLKEVDVFMSGGNPDIDDLETPNCSEGRTTPTDTRSIAEAYTAPRNFGKRRNRSSVTFADGVEGEGRRTRAKTNPNSDSGSPSPTDETRQGTKNNNSVPARQKTPFPKTPQTPSPKQESPLSRNPNSPLVISPTSAVDESISYFTFNATQAPPKQKVHNQSCCPSNGMPCTSNAPLLSPPLTPIRRTPPSTRNSSEYIDRYQPKGPESRHQKYSARAPEPILGKMLKTRAKSLKEQQQDEDKAAEEKAGEAVEKKECAERPRLKRMSQEEYSLDPKESLRQELKSLFQE